MATSHVPPQATDDETPIASPSRRRLLKLGAVGLGGIGLAAVSGAQPASATDGQPVVLGAINTSSGRTTIETSAAGQIAVRAYNLATTGSGIGLYGDAAGPDGTGVVGVAAGIGVSGSSTAGIGVSGSSTAGIGVSGSSTAGFGVTGSATDGWGLQGDGGAGGVWGVGQNPTSPGLFVTGSGMVRMDPGQIAPPTSGFYFQGSLLCSKDGSGTWLCVTSGAPGMWRKVAGPATAGAFHAIPPQRVFDSRRSGPLKHGKSVDISLADGIDDTGSVTVPDLIPVGATAVALNLSVLGPTGTGVLTAWPQGLTRPLATAVQWTAAGQAVTNGFTAAISATRELSVYFTGTGTIRLQIDVGGYYL